MPRPPAYDKARAVMRYDEASRGPILALKHGDRLDLMPGFARWLGRGGAALLDEADLIVPVPLHPYRLWTRRYNQAAELARALARHAGKPANFLCLTRSRDTPQPGRHALRQGAAPQRAGRIPGSARPQIRHPGP
ncbi:MAG: hypothetical protein WDN08_18150 [Rhizomicrobium sp.]